MGDVAIFLARLGEILVALLRYLSERRLLAAGRAEAVRDGFAAMRGAVERARAARDQARRSLSGDDDERRLHDDGFRRD